MLLVYGEETVRDNWHVCENSPPAFARIYCVDDGEVTYIDADQQKRLNKGHTYIFPTSAAYHMEHNPLKPLRCVYLHLDVFPNMVEKLMEIDLSRDQFLYHLFEALRMAIRNKEKRLISLLSEVFIEFCTGKKYITQPAVTIRAVLEYISLHIKEEISIGSLSKIAGYNSQYFVRLFKQNMGITPYQYIINYRLKEAVELFRTNISFSEIAQNVGYPDLKSFSRAFKLRYGVPPSHFFRPAP